MHNEVKRPKRNGKMLSLVIPFDLHERMEVAKETRGIDKTWVVKHGIQRMLEEIEALPPIVQAS